jgi:hypothetical protein
MSLVVLLGVSAIAGTASAVQTSGSILLVPSQQDPLAPGQQFTVAVYAKNTSSATPFMVGDPVPPPFVSNAAVLTGPVSVDYACLDNCQCANQNTTDISFLGCDLTGAQGTGCVAGAAGEVLVNLPAAGLNLPNDTPVLLATLKLKNNNAGPLPLPRHFLRSTTAECALKSCIDNVQQIGCVDCAAEGCAFVSGVSTSSPPLSCKHGCNNKIEFFPQTPAQPDNLHVNALIQQIGYDPGTQPFSLTVTKGATTIYSVSVPFVPLLGSPANGTWLQKPDPSLPGLDQILITKRTGVGVGGVDCTMDWFKIIVDAHGDFSAAAMTNPTLTITYTLNGVAHSVTGVWTSVNSASGIKQITFDIPDRSPC